MAYLETVFIEGSAGAVLDSVAGTPNSQALTIQGNASGVPVPVSGTLTSTILGVAAVSGVIGTTQAGTFAVASTQGGSWAISATQGTLPWVTTATITGTPTVTATLSGISAISGVVGATQAGAFAVSSTQGGSWAVSATQGTSPWVTTSTIQGTTAVQGVVGATQGGSWAVAATQGTSPWVCTATVSGTAAENLLAVGGILLGTTAVTLFGSTPAASTVPGVNAFVTNVVTTTQANQAVTQGGSWAVSATQGTSPWVTTSTIQGTVTAEIEGHAGGTLDGAAGSPSTQCVTVQGNSSGTPIPITYSGLGPVAPSTAAANSNLIGGVFNSTAPAPTTGQQTAIQQDSKGSAYVNTEGRKATYVVSLQGQAIIANINLTLQGSSTKIIRITRLTFSGLATTATSSIVSWGITTAAYTGGTSASTNFNQGTLDSNNPAATAAPLYYTSGVSGGGAPINIETFEYPFELAASLNYVVSSTYGNRAAQCPTLRGTTQFLYLSIPTAPTGGKYTVAIEWTEE